MTIIYIVKENYIDIYKNEPRQFIHKFETISGTSSFVEDMGDKSFALEHTLKIYKFELGDEFRLFSLEKELL